MKALAILGCAAAAALASSAALGYGGPSPGALVGGHGVVAPRSGIRYVAFTGARSTTVAAVLVHGGQIARYTTLSGSYGVPLVAYDGTAGGISADGRTLVLTSFAGGPVTRFAVLRLPSLHRRATVALRGTFAFDALSPNARTMYLIQYGRNDVNYRVRAYDIPHRRLLPGAVVDKSEAGEPMRGAPQARVSGDRGRWAYTLYAGGRKPFVHALDTVRRTAVCVDLPHAGTRLALHANHLVVLGANGSRVAIIDTRTLRVST
jgi:hypothetical protein